MIQKMSKYAFLTFHREHTQFLEQLRDLGVVHIQEQRKSSEVEELRAILQERNHIKEQIKTLRPYLPKEEAELRSLQTTITESEYHSTLARIPELLKQKEGYKVQIEQTETKLAELEPWGEFSLDNLTRLVQSGYQLRFYTTTSSVFTTEYSDIHGALQINKIGSTVYFVVLSSVTDSVDLPEAQSISTPQCSVTQLQEKLKQLHTERESFEKAFTDELLLIIPQLEAYDRQLSRAWVFGNAEAQSLNLADDKLRLLEGWIPTAEASTFEEQLNQLGYYYKQLEISTEDSIPIKLRNNAFARPFELITEMFSLPNASEIDQTVLIAPFFMLFFGLCFGDGGYGAILLIVATYFKFKNKGKDNSLLTLLQFLGGTAVLVGFAMGSLFGVTLGYAQVKGYIFDQTGMMYLSIILGLVQIFFAKLVAAYKIKVQRGINYALAPFAWVVGLVALGIYTLLSEQLSEAPEWVSYTLYGVIGLSFGVAFFYNTPGKNPLLNFGTGLWTAYNTASGLLGDTLSYIRLFAIGLTGGILGSVFNDLALGTANGINPILGYPLALIILLLGHGLNIGLAMISSFVHPLRLTFVEYYKNSEFEGGGKPYTPFKK